MKNERILIEIPGHLKEKLDVLRTQGYTISGFIRALLERELAHIKLDKPKPRPRIGLED
ncbi:hypothetical protein [Candidatus Nitrospira allomarina]|uniref:Uncharacterized protein n=1 Tax=Candidatus Nitrospira allomarina TaxID=3020900 RepID=A0AA96GIK6_9BACT|nr:hypothetical protein [Candidatus Nitrospira allomarina]WNM59598.1 hypothetical protein PP769_07545 [Candidatus Nitrospira allomarina]